MELVSSMALKLGGGLLKLCFPVSPPGHIMFMFAGIYHQFVKVLLIFYSHLTLVSVDNAVTPVAGLSNLSEKESIVI